MWHFRAEEPTVTPETICGYSAFPDPGLPAGVVLVMVNQEGWVALLADGSVVKHQAGEFAVDRKGA